MTARMCHWVIGMMFNKSAGCVSSLKASALQTCVFHRPLAFPHPSLHIYSIQVLRLECLTQDSPRGQVRGPRYLLAPWIPHSRSCLWWKPERRDPPERWLHPSCPKEQMGSWCLFRVLLELQVRHNHNRTCSTQHCFAQLMFLFYFIASPQKPTDILQTRTHVSSGKCSFLNVLHYSRAHEEWMKLFLFDQQMWACLSDPLLWNVSWLQVRL